MNDYSSTELAFFPGGRPYNNKDFRVMQQLVLDTTSFFMAFQNINSGEFIVSGCATLGAPGFVWLGSYNIDPDVNQRKLRYVETWTGTPLFYPCYIAEDNSTQSRTYKDGQVKNVFLINKAKWSQTLPVTGNYITVVDAPTFASIKLETFLASVGASFWTQVPATTNIRYSGGKVAIGGSIDPQGTLEVLGNQATIVARQTAATNYASVRIYNDQNLNTRALEIGYTGSTFASTPITGGLSGESAYIATTGAYPMQIGTNNASRITILSNGNVGIGLTAPAVKLDVSGAISSTGNITSAGNLNATGAVNSASVATGAIATTGTISAGTTITAATGLTVTSGNIAVSAGTITSSGNISSGGTISASTLSGGTLSIGGGGTFGGAVTISSGNLTLTTGNGTANDWIATSDVSLKNDIQDIVNPLDKVLALKGRTYKLNAEDSGKTHYGFIAQEVEQIIPELIEYINEEKTLKGVNYDKVTSLLVEAIKEQQKIIQHLSDRLDNL